MLFDSVFGQSNGVRYTITLSSNGGILAGLEWATLFDFKNIEFGSDATFNCLASCVVIRLISHHKTHSS